MQHSLARQHFEQLEWIFIWCFMVQSGFLNLFLDQVPFVALTYTQISDHLHVRLSTNDITCPHILIQALDYIEIVEIRIEYFCWIRFNQSKPALRFKRNQPKSKVWACGCPRCPKMQVYLSYKHLTFTLHFLLILFGNTLSLFTLLSISICMQWLLATCHLHWWWWCPHVNGFSTSQSDRICQIPSKNQHKLWFCTLICQFLSIHKLSKTTF